MLSPRTSHDLLSRGMRDVLTRMERAGRPALHTLEPSQAKQAYLQASGVLDVPAASLPRVQDFDIPSRDGSRIPVRLYAPAAGMLPCLVYFHGGGFMVGSIRTHDVLCRELARLSGCAVLSVDYRLAPEHRFPTAHNDAWDSVLWLGLHGHEIGVDADRLAVGGDSAGGTLAAACAVHARDAGLRLHLQLLFYPGTAGLAQTRSRREFASGMVLEAAHIDWFFAHYIDAHRADDWRFAPLQIADPQGLAPAWIGLAECDPLVDEGLDFADLLRATDNPVQLEIYRGVTHEFIRMGRALPQALEAHGHAARAIHAALKP